MGLLQVLCIYVMDISLCFVGISLTFFLPPLGTLFLLLITLCNIVMKAFALSYCILFFPIWLLSLGSLLFSKEETEWEGIRRRVEGEGSWKEWREGSCGWDILYGRKGYFQQGKKENIGIPVLKPSMLLISTWFKVNHHTGKSVKEEK